MLSLEAQELQSCKARPYINSMPTEIFHMIIREYALASTTSITLKRSSAMNFLVVCKRWAAIGQRCQHLFRGHLVVSGHDEMVQFIDLYRSHMIPSSITSLTVNLTPTYAGDGTGLVPAMVQVQEDLGKVCSMIRDASVFQGKKDGSSWKTLRINKFSLCADLSAVSAQKALFKGWTRHWVLSMGQEWRQIGWKGEEKSSDSGVYSDWTEPDDAWLFKSCTGLESCRSVL